MAKRPVLLANLPPKGRRFMEVEHNASEVIREFGHENGIESLWGL